MLGNEYIDIARGLVEAGDFSAADGKLSEAFKFWPNDFRIAVELAMCAMKAGNWHEALRRWDVARTLNPAIDAIGNQRGVALMHVQQETALTSSRAPVDIERVENPKARALVLQFESLGENCEFGLLQRRFEAEPLGLLRWTYTHPRTLISLLESRFAGLGDQAKLNLSRAPWGEYFLKDTAYGVTFHTYLRDCGGDEEAFLRKQSGRLVWLREKMLGDLTTGGKKYVYKLHYGAPDEVASRMLTLLKGYADNTLVCVRAAGSDDAPGSIKVGQDGMISGYLTRVEPTANNNWDICYSDWLSICQSVTQLTSGAPQ